MDRHNNRPGWSYMIRRRPSELDGKRIPDFGICKRIRRLAANSVVKARFVAGSARLVRGTNRFRPIYRKKRDATGFAVKLKPQTPSFDPCGPLKPGRG